ncbi:hypothetical protein ACQPZA_15455 [Pseudonocardia xinjiangensis]|uniref:hypothetical protein n=1 Tax=Pseudonocardia xinjiangensis TaxID=75289 RepID=UPI003D8AFF95
MTYVRGFIPWIVFAVVSTVGWQWGALAGAGAGAVLLLRDRAAGVAPGAQILDMSTVLYLTALCAVAFEAPHSPLQGFDGALSSAWLALTAWVTVAVRRPFSLGIARRRTPASSWHTPRFRHVNVVISSVWAAGFTAAAVATALCDVTDAGSIAKAVCQVVTFGAPALFTTCYVRRSRAAAQPGRV